MSAAAPPAGAAPAELGGGSYLLTLAAFATGPIAALAPLALSPLLLVTALTLAWRRYRIDGARALLRAVASGWTAATLLLLVLIGSASVLWSLHPGTSAAMALRLLLTVASGILIAREAAALTAAERQPLLVGLVAGCVCLLVLLSVEALSDAAIHRAIRAWTGATSEGGISTINRQATCAALLAWPAALALWRGGFRLGAVAVLAMAGLLLVRLDSGAALAGFAVGAAVVPLVWLAPRAAPRLIAAAVAVGILAAPLLPLTVIAPGVAVPQLASPYGPAVHRLHIWRFVAEHIQARPILGYGLEGSRDFPGGERHVLDLYPDAAGVERTVGVLPVLPLHPHNAALQVWLELGAPGAAVFAALLALVLAAAARAPTAPEAAAMAATAVTAIATALLAYGIWQGWWVATLFLTAAWTIAAGGALPADRGPAPAAEAAR